ncbi:putative PGG domain-containing protein [Medicago truncatula]|uniref:Putative PGG domain-containing protein n=1 Tax=Medicago truncatula TaxID=3880 RepID=A0A396GD41_MEDTR|nr:putative PGG domain-containing protein [Medicago truncatula]
MRRRSYLSYLYHDEYLRFLICNTICFIASLSVILLLVSGIPINNKFSMWLLSIGMSIVITSLALTYLYAANMVTPTPFGVLFRDWVWCCSYCLGLDCHSFTCLYHSRGLHLCELL